MHGSTIVHRPASIKFSYFLLSAYIELSCRFTRYVNSGLSFLNLEQLRKSYKTLDLQKTILPELVSDEKLNQNGQWPPEQWLWKAIFEHNPEYLALFNSTTHCNCASHREIEMNQDIGSQCCVVIHYCNSIDGTTVLDSQDGFARSVVQYLTEKVPDFVQKIKNKIPSCVAMPKKKLGNPLGLHQKTGSSRWRATIESIIWFWQQDEQRWCRTKGGRERCCQFISIAVACPTMIL